MSESKSKKRSHRNSERYNCPPFFAARIRSGDTLEAEASIEDLSLRGLKARTNCSFDEGSDAEIELKSKYAAPVRIRARVMWVSSDSDERFSHVVGFLIKKIRMRDWYRFFRIISQIKKEVW